MLGCTINFASYADPFLCKMNEEIEGGSSGESYLWKVSLWGFLHCLAGKYSILFC